MADQHQQQDVESRAPAVIQEVDRLLNETTSFQHLDAPTRNALRQSMTKIAGYLAGEGNGLPLAEQLAPTDLRSRIGRGRGAGGNEPTGQPPTTPTPGAPGGAGRNATLRAGEVARATLNAIQFPEFVASLIQGTFQAIVDASIEQMEAYAELLKNVSLTVDQFMEDNISDGMARDYLADRYEGVFTSDTSSGRPVLRMNEDSTAEALPSFFQGLGLTAPDDIDEDAINDVIVPATRRTLAEQRQQMLATMVLMGINRVIVDDGEISAKLQFHIDASESTKFKFDQTKTSVGNISGTAGRNLFAGNGIMVNTTNLNAQSDVNVRADLTGQVKVRFRSETFPLERFADSLAIQLINSRAQVPQTSVEGGPDRGSPPPSQQQSNVPDITPAPVSNPPPAPPADTPAAQAFASRDPKDDPWAPRA